MLGPCGPYDWQTSVFETITTKEDKVVLIILPRRHGASTLALKLSTHYRNRSMLLVGEENLQHPAYLSHLYPVGNDISKITNDVDVLIVDHSFSFSKNMEKLVKMTKDGTIGRLVVFDSDGVNNQEHLFEEAAHIDVAALLTVI